MFENDLFAESGKFGLDPSEVRSISAILDAPEVKAALDHAEKWRKIKIAAYLCSMAALVLILVGAFADGANTITVNGVSRPSAATDAIPFLLPPAVMFTLLLFASFKGGAEKALKGQLIPRLLEVLQPGAKYSTGGTYSAALENLVRKGFLNSYDRIDCREDSFEFTHEKDGKSITVRGMELVTSKMQGGKKKKRTTTNRCLLMQGEYPETKFEIDRSVHVKGDVADSKWLNAAFFLVPTLLVSIVTLKGRIRQNGVMVPYENPPELALTYGIIAGLAVWLIARYAINRNRVKLENVAFEKLFDVKCEDQILSRMVLTPAFMDRLVRFVEKTKGAYEFLFEGDRLYLKKDLRGPFLEINGMRNLKENARMFLVWYSELKEIVSLISDTGVLVFSRTDFSEREKQPTVST